MLNRWIQTYGTMITAALAVAILLAAPLAKAQDAPAADVHGTAVHESTTGAEPADAASHGSSGKTFDEVLHEQEDMSVEVEGHETHGTAAHAEGAHGEAHGDGGLPQFDITTFPSQMFWLAVAFVVMYMTFSTRTLPVISSTLENRREHIQNDLETAERLRAEAEQVQNAYETGLDKARAESTRLLNDAINGVKADGDAALNQLREKGDRELAALEQRLAQSGATARAQMDTIAAEVAHQAAEKIFGISTDIKKAQNVVQSINAREAA